MPDWTGGYVADIGYTFGYYKELNPINARLAFLHAGLEPPTSVNACELGFGQGMCINLHAAGSTVSWYGNDFNPSQTHFAKLVAAASGANPSLSDDSFLEFFRRTDLPDFDFIGMHGIWSWINDENRAAIVDFLRRKLRVGGVLFLSYNSLPGWATFAPMRHLMVQHADRLGSIGNGIAERIDGALQFGESLLAVSPMFSTSNPAIVERFKGLQGRDRNYLAHEYFNRDWHPMHFATVANWLEPAKLSYVCSASYLDNVDEINLTGEQQEFLDSISDPVLRESAYDFIVNRQFRRDYWVKGPLRMTPHDHTQALREHRVLLTTYRPDASLTVTGALGEMALDGSVINPILDLMADHHIRSLGEIADALTDQDIDLDQVFSTVRVLTGAGQFVTAQDPEITKKARPFTDRLNTFLLGKSRDSKGSGISYLVSPVTGGGVSGTRNSQLFLYARSQGLQHPEEWASAAWESISGQGEKVFKDGKPLESRVESIAELTSYAQEFAEKRLPILKALQVV